MRRSGTFLPYLQTSAPLDYNKISNFYTNRCGAEEVHADGNFKIENPTDTLKRLIEQGDQEAIEEFQKNNPAKGGPQMGPIGGSLGGKVGRLHNAKQYQGPSPLEPYIDTRKRVIRVEFPVVPLPDGSRATLEKRKSILYKNDVLLSKIMDVIPSPMVTIIYSSTIPEYGEISEQSSGPYHDYMLIEDMIRLSKQPENRDMWKLHANYQHQKSIDADENEDDEDSEVYYPDAANSNDKEQVQRRKEEWKKQKREMMKEKGYPNEQEDMFQKKRLPLMQESRLQERNRLKEAHRNRKSRDKDTLIEQLDDIFSTEMVLIVASICLFIFVIYGFIRSMGWLFSLVFGKTAISSSSPTADTVNTNQQKQETLNDKKVETEFANTENGISSSASSVQRRKVTSN